MTIKRVTSVDESIISQLNQLLEHPWEQGQAVQFLANEDNALFLAFEETEVIAFLTAHRLQRLDKRKAEVLLYEVEVKELFRQRGVGKALIEAVKNWGKQVGADEVWVLTYQSNLPAMKLYASSGGVEDEPGTTMFTFVLQ